MYINKKVLIVEDDTDDQLLMCEAFDDLFPKILYKIANNGKEALQLVEFPPPYDIIFLDINMPIMNGYECLQSLKENKRFKNIPVVIMSSSDDLAVIQKTRALGAHRYFTKPEKYDDLKEEIRKSLELIA